jgi:hypothetical protein
MWIEDTSREERKTLSAAFAGYATDAFDYMIYTMLIPTLIAVWGMTRTQAGAIATGSLITSAIGGWAAGVLSDKEVYQANRAKVREDGNEASFLEIFSSKLFSTTLRASLLATGMMGAYYAITTWLPTYLKTERQLSVLNTSGCLLVLILGSFLGYLTSAYLTDRIGRRRIFHGRVPPGTGRLHEQHDASRNRDRLPGCRRLPTGNPECPHATRDQGTRANCLRLMSLTCIAARAVIGDPPAFAGSTVVEISRSVRLSNTLNCGSRVVALNSIVLLACDAN